MSNNIDRLNRLERIEALGKRPAALERRLEVLFDSIAANQDRLADSQHDDYWLDIRCAIKDDREEMEALLKLKSKLKKKEDCPYWQAVKYDWPEDHDARCTDCQRLMAS